MFEVTGLSLTPIDGRTVRLHRPADYREETKEGEIIRLYKEGTPIEIVVGGSIKYKDARHRVNVIQRGTRKGQLACYDLKCAVLNSSSIFALPFLGGSKKYMLWDSLFVNAFISTEEYDECIALLYRYSGDVLFSKFEKAMCAMPNFIKMDDVDHYHVLFIFKVPDSAKDSYQKFREGRYSEIDGIWKLMILNYHDFDPAGQTGKILYKDAKLKAELETKLDIELGDSELHSIPDMKYERFNKEYYSTL
jgi:hypothetical protein